MNLSTKTALTVDTLSKVRHQITSDASLVIRTKNRITGHITTVEHYLENKFGYLKLVYWINRIPMDNQGKNFRLKCHCGGSESSTTWYS